MNLAEEITIKEMMEKQFENTSYGCPHCGGLLSVTGSCMNDCGWEKDSKPETPRAMALWRAGTCCEIGKKAINGETETPSGSTPLEYALYNLLCAVQDIARAMEAEDRKD